MKLIILNGSPAAGKSTVAKKLHEAMPMSLLADVDLWRTLVSGWKENRTESLALAYKYTVGAVGAYLKTGHDVIVDKAILSDDSVIDALVESGKANFADVYEFILIAKQDIIEKRAEARGFHENGLLTREKVTELWHTAQNLIPKRSNAIVIDTSEIEADAVFQKIKEMVGL